jgi:hypothetical protein
MNYYTVCEKLYSVIIDVLNFKVSFFSHKTFQS